MGSETGSLSAGDRLDRQEAIHAPGGTCETRLEKLKAAVEAVQTRLTTLEIKLMLIVAIAQIVVTFAVQVILKVWFS